MDYTQLAVPSSYPSPPPSPDAAISSKNVAIDDGIRPSRMDSVQDQSSRTPGVTHALYDPKNPDHHAIFLKLLRAAYPHHEIQPLRTQGGCSFTLLCISSPPPIGTPTPDLFILQIRSLRFAIPLPLMRRAQHIHSSLIADVEELLLLPGLASAGFQITRTPLLPGVRLSELLPQSLHSRTLDHITIVRVKNILYDLAAFHARAWKAGIRDVERDRVLTAQGKVGGSLVPRLTALAQSLPSRHLRRVARRVLRAVQQGGLQELPVVLTHGDLIASNLLVDAPTWRLTGVVDWAEAEWLPFGFSLYSVEVLLGELRMEGSKKRWVWCHGHRKLRAWFWKELGSKIGVLGELKDIHLARTVGVLLWFGFAWDDGRIDRVIDERDGGELQCLKAYLRA